jgi:CheY-like chemotaxis protein
MIFTTGDSTRILLVDDDKDDCVFFQEALKETGLNAIVRVVNESTGILKRLPDESGTLPNLIFLDLNMPTVDGIKCLREIRNAETFVNTPVIIFSTGCRTSDVEETFAIGANLYVQKPSAFILLTNILTQLIQLDWKEHLNERLRSRYVFTNR